MKKRKADFEELNLAPLRPHQTAQPTEQLKAAQDQLRANCAKALKNALGCDEGNAEVAEQAEEALYSLHSRDAGQDYKAAARTLVVNLKRNAYLRSRVLGGGVSPQQLVRMDSQQLATDERKEADAAIVEAQTKRVTLAGAGSTGGALLTNDYTCPRCRGTVCDYMDTAWRDVGKCETWGSKGTQGAARCVHCVGCGHKWEVDDL